LALQLFAPNGTMISPDINSNEISHARGQHCDNYLIRNSAPGNWILKVVSLEPSSEINNFDLVTGLVAKVPSLECCIPEGNTIMMPSGEVIEPVECLPVDLIGYKDKPMRFIRYLGSNVNLTSSNLTI